MVSEQKESSSPGKEAFDIEINLGPNRVEHIFLYDDENVADAARNFCKSRGLDLKQSETIARKIKEAIGHEKISAAVADQRSDTVSENVDEDATTAVLPITKTFSKPKPGMSSKNTITTANSWESTVMIKLREKALKTMESGRFDDSPATAKQGGKFGRLSTRAPSPDRILFSL